MRRLPILVTLTTLIITAVGAPAPSSRPTPLVRRDGPCDAASENCRAVIQANACFAAFVMLGTKEEVLQCVDHQDAARAEELVCECYGCAETTVQDWATGTLGCSASA